MLFQTEAHKRAAHSDHLVRGALRSSMGTAKQAYDRIQKFEDHEMIEKLIETKELVTDPIL